MATARSREIAKSKWRSKKAKRANEILLRLREPQLALLDAWIGRQADEPSRPEAVRRLLDYALSRLGESKRGRAMARKASELASRELESFIDKSKPMDERERAKQHLVQGPREFRDIRGDLPKRQ
jgi:hypothetical protein